MKIIILITMILISYGCKSQKGSQKNKDENPQATGDSTIQSQPKKSPPVEIIERMSCVKSDTECSEYRNFAKASLKTHEDQCQGTWSDGPCSEKRLLGSCRKSKKFSSQVIVQFFYYTEEMSVKNRVEKANLLSQSCSPPNIFSRAED